MKQKLSIAKIFFLLVGCIWFSDCKKSDIPSVNITLYDKPLAIIQENIQGEWRLIYGKGGISSNNVQYYHKVFWEFNNDRVTISDNGNISTDATIQWHYDMGTYTNRDSTFLMKFYDKQTVPWVYVVERIYNDTLILHDNSADPYFYHFVKSY